MRKETLTKTLDNMQVGQPLKYANMEVFPLFNTVIRKTKYITLKNGLKKGVLEIVEKNQSGTVSELRVINKGNKRVLLLDGEELAGAKQNRILNTTILLKKYSDTIIPVSCTEAGRWHYKTDEFYDSDVLAFPDMRSKKAKAVSENLKRTHQFRSNQAQIWDHVEKLSVSLSVLDSSTQAMKDVFREKNKDTKKYLEKILYQKKQKGVVVIINGQIVGVDYLSSSKAFKKLFPKLVKSYALQALEKTIQTKSFPKEQVKLFMDKIKKVEVSKFKSPGHGYDLRISGDGLSGNALQYRKEIIQLDVFSEKQIKEIEDGLP